MIKYADLTLAQKAFICNGCGGKGGWVNPPEFIFHASCNHHDFNYWVGGTEEDRLRADKGFYNAMKVDIASKPIQFRPYYHVWAYTYYKSVRLIGGKYFNYGRQKDENDLVQEILVYGT